jgi:hypothetical protein
VISYAGAAAEPPKSERRERIGIFQLWAVS